MARNKIFISYSRDDIEFVTRLVKGLRDKGETVWFDNHIRSGNQWDNTIEKEIRACDILITVLSETSVASHNVMDEVSFAMDLGKRIIPIRIKECDIPMRLRRYQYVDFTEGVQWGFSRLLDDIKNPESVEPRVRIRRKNKERPKKSNSLVPFLLGGLIFLVVFIVLVGVFYEEEDPIDPASFNNEDTIKDAGFDSTDPTSSEDIAEPAPAYGNTNPDSENEEDLTRTGLVLYQNAMGQVLFNKEMGGYPYVGDVLYALVNMEVYDESRNYTGNMLYAGQEVEVLQVLPQTVDGYYFLKVRYLNPDY